MITATAQAVGTKVCGELQAASEISVLTAFSFIQQISCSLGGGDVTIYSGLGLLDVKIDITSSLSSLGYTLARVEARVQYDDEQVASYEADSAVAASAPTDKSTSLYSEVVTSAACVDETKTFLQFTHDFANRGEYRIALTFWMDGGRYATTSEAIVVKCGDGLFDGDC